MDWVHLHLALNHVPVLGTPFVTLLMLTGIFKKSDELKRLALLWFVLLAAVSIPIKFTGDFAYEEVANELQIPLGTVKAQLFRARELLNQELKNIKSQM